MRNSEFNANQYMQNNALDSIDERARVARVLAPANNHNRAPLTKRTGSNFMGGIIAGLMLFAPACVAVLVKSGAL